MTIFTNSRSIAASVAACLLVSSQGHADQPVPKSPTWDSQATLSPSDGIALEQFGVAVAIDGDTALIGAQGDNARLHVADRSGSVYAWLRNGHQWKLQQKFVSPNPSAGQQFGSALAVQGDIAVVAAIGDHTHGELTGAYVFTRTGGTWTAAPQKLTGDEPLADDGEAFGASVAVSTDVVLVGAPGSDEKGEDAGAAYLFKRQSGTWILARKLFAPDPLEFAGFGYSVALIDGVAVVGAPDADSPGTPDSGAVYVFSGDFSGPPSKLVSSDHTSGDLFGVSVSARGTTIAVGAISATGGSDASAPPHAGAVYIFNGSDSNWLEQQKLFKPIPETGDSFGASVAMGNDSLFVVSPTDYDGGSSAFAFTFTDGSWSAGVQVLPPAELGGALYAPAVGLSGKTAVIASFGEKAAVFALAGGSPCSATADCSLGSCTEEGACCRTACDGKCVSCVAARTGAADGTCAPVSKGTDPRDDCDAQPASTCLETGWCDGEGACSKYPDRTECAAASCSTPTTVTSSFCDGSGQCKAELVNDCGSYLCHVGQCASTCTASSDCAPSSFCSADSTCKLLQPKSCNANATAAIGTDGTTLEPCGDYRCVNGACLETCATTDDCSGELACNTSTGTCAAKCETAATCSGGQACDPVDHVCTEICTAAKDCVDGRNCGPLSRQCTKKADCANTSDCSDGFACDALSKQCAKTCEAASDCPNSKLACDALSHICTVACLAARDCALGLNCGPTRRCTTDATCSSTGDCAAPLVCDLASGLCSDSCSAASDCDNDFACDPINHVCTPLCSSATVCREGLSCSPATHQCTRDLDCVLSSDCAAPLVCDLASRQCAASCSAASDCDNDFACDPANHVCTRRCSSASSCRDGLNCSPSSHQCTGDMDCSSSNDCAAGLVCSPSTRQCTADQPHTPAPVGDSCSFGRAPSDWTRQGAALAFLALLSVRRRKAARR